MRKLALILSLFSFSFAQNYQLIDTENTNLPNRARGKIFIYVDSTDKAEREALLKEAIIKFVKDNNKKYADGFILPIKYRNPFIGYYATATYDVDGCGVDGKTCTQQSLKIKGNSKVLTAEELKIVELWNKHYEEFDDKVNYDFDEDGLVALIAKKLKIKPEDVSLPYIFNDE